MPAHPLHTSPCLERAVIACKPLGACLSRLAHRAYSYVTVEAPDPNADYYYGDETGTLTKVVTAAGKQFAVERERLRREKTRALHVNNVVGGVGAVLLGCAAGIVHPLAAAVGVFGGVKVGQLGRRQAEVAYDLILEGWDRRILDAEKQGRG